MVVLDVCCCWEDAKDGVGDRLNASGNVGDVDEGGIVGDSGLSVKAWGACVAGTGVETPRALASFASRCGGKGERGAGHVGCAAFEEVGERCDELSASLWCVLGMMVVW